MPQGQYSLSDAMPADQAGAANAQIPKDWLRDDGSVKGQGFLGLLRLPDGGVASEWSIAESDKLKDPNGNYLDYPSLVPTLTREEVEAVIRAANDPTKRTPLPESVIDKATAFALQRKAQGKPLFAQPGEEQDLYPDLPRAPLPSFIANRRSSGQYTLAEAQPVDTPTATKPAAAPTSFQLRDYLPAGIEENLIKGAAEGVLSTARGVAGAVLPQQAEEALSAERQKAGLPSVASLTAPANTAQRIGKGAEQIAEFFLPEGLLEHLAPAASAATKMAAIAGSNAALAHVQGAGPVGSAVAGGLGAVGQAPRFTSDALSWLANKIESGVLKASAKDYQSGFNPANVFRYQLGGSPAETFTKASQTLSELGAALKQTLRQVPNAPPVDMTGLRNEVLASWRGNPDAAAALDRIEQAVAFRLNGQGVAPKLLAGGRVGLDLADANTAKQAVGDLGAWITDPTGKVVSDADRMTEQVANRYYSLLKNRIQQQAGAAGGSVQALNRQMADIIPIRTAALRRFPVADRQSLVNLLDVLAMTTGHVPLGIGVKALNTGEAANAVSRLAQHVGMPPAVAQVGAALSSQAAQGQ